MRLILFALAIILPLPVFAQEPPASCPDIDPAQLELGKQAFGDHCGRCHEQEMMSEWVAGQPEGAAEANLVAFLARHGSCSPPVDAAIAAYVMSIAVSE